MTPLSPKPDLSAEQEPLFPSPTTWKEYAAHHGPAVVSCYGYLCFFCALSVLPASAIMYGKVGAMNCATVMLEGGAVLAASVVTASAIKVVDAARTAFCYGWSEAKVKLRDAISQGGYIRRALIPNVAQMIDEAVTIVRTSRGAENPV